MYMLEIRRMLSEGSLSTARDTFERARCECLRVRVGGSRVRKGRRARAGIIVARGDGRSRRRAGCGGFYRGDDGGRWLGRGVAPPGNNEESGKSASPTTIRSNTTNTLLGVFCFYSLGETTKICV